MKKLLFLLCVGIFTCSLCWADTVIELDDAPEFFQPVAISFRKLREAQKKALLSKKERDRLSTELPGLPAANTREYNELLTVTQYNYQAAQPPQKSDEIMALNTRIQNLDVYIRAYADSLSRFEAELYNKRLEAEEGLSPEEHLYLGTLQAGLAQMQQDFTTTFVDYRADASGISVPVVFNDVLSAELIVETEASLVLLSPGLARKLGIVITRDTRMLLLTLGDGRKVEAYPVVLNSLKVGAAQAKNVLAAVLTENTAMDGDGFLGLSFLGHFSFKIDEKSQQLILKELVR